MDREQVFAAVVEERRRIADLVDGLDEDSLAAPSLCAGWDVKTVATHLVSVFADQLLDVSTSGASARPVRPRERRTGATPCPRAGGGDREVPP